MIAAAEVPLRAPFNEAAADAAEFSARSPMQQPMR